jgi:ParB-like chromosome segregation protein Spo0J
MNELATRSVSTSSETTDDEGAESASVEFEPLEILVKLKVKAEAQSAKKRPEVLPLVSIVVEPRLFQPRGEDERHIQDLVRAIKTQGQVEPVTVVQVGSSAVLVDGHHRLIAYRIAKATSAVPVRYFDGTLEEAVLEAGRMNSKVKRPMSNKERQDYAWRLVLMGTTYSKRQIKDAAVVSDGQVGTMRKGMRALGDNAFEARTWWQARQKAKGLEFNPFTEDEEEQRLDELAQEYALRLSKAFDTKLPNNPDLAARAFAIHFGRHRPSEDSL